MNTNTSRSRFLIGLVVVAVLAGVAVTGGVAAQNATNGTATDNGTGMDDGTGMDNGTPMDDGTPMGNGTMATNASLTTDDSTAGVTANHTVTVTIPEAVAGNLTSVSINYTEANASTEPALDAALVSVEGANQSIPVGTAPDGNVTVQATEFLLAEFTLDLNQSYQPAAGEQFTFTYPVQNPSEPGNYTIPVVLNPDLNNTVNYSTNLSVTPSEATPTADGTTTGMMGDGTTTGMMGNETTTGMMGNETTTEEDGIGAGDETETAAEEETPTEEEDGAGAAGETTTSGNGPGFTALAALVGVLAAALLATRRN